LLVGGGLDVEGIQAVTTLGKKVKTNNVALEEGIHKWHEVGSAGKVTGKGADCQVDLCSKDGEQSVVEGDIGIKMHLPELRSHLEDIICGQVYRKRVSMMLLALTIERRLTVCTQDEDSPLVGEGNAFIERECTDICGEEGVCSNLLRQRHVGCTDY
jgi:hypothetical protein